MMATTGMDPKDWQSLLHQTNDLVAQVRTSRCRTRNAREISNMGCCVVCILLLRTQDFHHFPKVDRNIAQLQSYAGSLRARTNKFRTLNNQIAATRLLAQQGFDASRCVFMQGGGAPHAPCVPSHARTPGCHACPPCREDVPCAHTMHS